jgi:hypothetical protein
MLESPANKDLLERAVAAIKAGDKSLGERLLRQVLSTDPNNVWALLWLTKCSSDSYRIAELYQRVLRIEPENPHAKKGVELYRKYIRESRGSEGRHPFPEGDLSPSQFEPSSPGAPAPSNRNLKIALAVCVILLLGSLAALIGPKLWDLARTAGLSEAVPSFPDGPDIPVGGVARAKTCLRTEMAERPNGGSLRGEPQVGPTSRRLPLESDAAQFFTELWCVELVWEDTANVTRHSVIAVGPMGASSTASGAGQWANLDFTTYDTDCSYYK